jgi:hypothetical protein
LRVIVSSHSYLVFVRRAEKDVFEGLFPWFCLQLPLGLKSEYFNHRIRVLVEWNVCLTHVKVMRLRYLHLTLAFSH